MMLLALLSVRPVSGFRGTLTNQTNANLLVSKSPVSCPLRHSRRLCSQGNYDASPVPDSSTKKTSASEGANNTDFEKVLAEGTQLEKLLAQTTQELVNLRVEVRSALHHLSIKVHAPPPSTSNDLKRKKPDDGTEQPDGGNPRKIARTASNQSVHHKEQNGLTDGYFKY